MRTLTTDAERVGAYVIEKAKLEREALGQFTAIGVERDGVLIGGVLFAGYNKVNVEIHMAGESRWIGRDIIGAVFWYVFEQLECLRCTGFVRSDNPLALAVDLKLGFRIEAVLKDYVPEGDMILLCMRKGDCKYLEKDYGRQIQSASA